MTNLLKTKINISELQIGMTVEFNNELITVGKNDLYKNEFGFAFKGDSSQKKITRIQFIVPTALGIIFR